MNGELITKSRRLIARAASCATLAIGLCACASIIHSGHQDVSITSVPSSATVTIDHSERGKTPLVANLTRKDSHFVRIETPGYQPFEATLKRSVSGWVWGNIVFGGLIGLVVDATSGGMYKLTPEQVTATLATGQASVKLHDDGIYVVGVLKADPEWTKIGQLGRE